MPGRFKPARSNGVFQKGNQYHVLKFLSHERFPEMCFITCFENLEALTFISFLPVSVQYSIFANRNSPYRVHDGMK
jgi:hypothetical protein